MRSTLLAFGFLAMTALAPACGTMDEESDGDIAVSTLEGLDVPVDSAGGHFVRNKGTLAVGATKSGTLTGRDLYHGYTIAAQRGDTLRLRGVTPTYMALVAIYGPQAADGSWGAQVTKKWSYRPEERKIPTVEYAVTKAGKYLAVFGVPQRDSATQPYALSACKGECVPGGCLEWSTHAGGVYTAVNLLNRAEAVVVSNRPNIAEPAIRSGSCDSQSRACTRERAPVCGQVPGVEPSTYGNICLAKVAQRDAMAGKLAPLNLWAPDGACHP